MQFGQGSLGAVEAQRVAPCQQVAGYQDEVEVFSGVQVGDRPAEEHLGFPDHRRLDLNAGDARIVGPGENGERCPLALKRGRAAGGQRDRKANPQGAAPHREGST